jgi:hypothetical protein
MTETLTPDRSSWRALLEEITRGRRGESVTLEVLDDGFGDQVEARDLPLESLDFDDRADTVVVALDGRAAGSGVVLRHLVRRPRRLDVLEQPHCSLVLRIVADSGTQTLFICRPRAAPAP